MATELKSANVTKYDAGGSGDNCIADGYIKAVEKVWIDSCAFTSALATTTSICLGVIPKGARLTEICVFMPAMYTKATLSTIYLCTGATVATSTYFGSMKADGQKTTTFNSTSMTTLRLAPGYQQKTIGSDLHVWMTLISSDGKTTVTTAGTIGSIIKYT